MMRLPAEGETFGRYRLLRKLGQGGMGVVYAAQDATLGREVAVKLVVPHLAGDDEFRARFQHEAAVLARLESPRIVRIYDHGEHDDVLYLVTQLVAGGDLAALVNREGALPPALATSVLTQVLEGLCDAHAVGVVHRDIKPANVLLRQRGRDFEAFLCDFGIATTPGADLSRTGTIAGSLPYMAPERHQGADAGQQGDVYAAGCLLWHALTGTAPYAGTDVEIALAHMQAPVPQLPGKDAFSSAVNEVLRRAMAKDRKKRYPTARAMHAELVRVAALAPDAISLPGATAIRQPVAIGTRPRAWVPAAAAVLASVAVLVTAVVAGGAISDGGDGTVAEPSVLAPYASESSASPTPTAEDDPQVIARPTLVPRGSARRAPAWETGADAPEMGLDEFLSTQAPERSEAQEAQAPAPARTAAPETRSSAPRPRATRTVREPRPTATETYTPPPDYNYRCWDGAQTYRYAECSAPVGTGGADWVYPQFSQLGCSPYDVKGTTRDVESWICGYGRDSWITFARWSDPKVAKEKYRAWFGYRRTIQEWSRDGTRYGVHMYGRAGGAGARWRWARIYERQPWTVAVNASSKDLRARGYQLVNTFRPPAYLKGVPID